MYIICTMYVSSLFSYYYNILSLVNSNNNNNNNNNNIIIAMVLSNRHSCRVTWECHKYCSLQLIEKDMFTHGSLFDIGPLEQTASLIIALVVSLMYVCPCNTTMHYT